MPQQQLTQSQQLAEPTLLTITEYISLLVSLNRRLDKNKISKSEAQLAFTEVDSKRKGYLDLANIYDLCGEDISEDELFYVFKWLDKSESGDISFNDFISAVTVERNVEGQGNKSSKTPVNRVKELISVFLENLEYANGLKKKYGFSEKNLGKLYNELASTSGGKLTIDAIISCLSRTKSWDSWCQQKVRELFFSCSEVITQDEFISRFSESVSSVSSPQAKCHSPTNPLQNEMVSSGAVFINTTSSKPYLNSQYGSESFAPALSQKGQMDSSMPFFRNSGEPHYRVADPSASQNASETTYIDKLQCLNRSEASVLESGAGTRTGNWLGCSGQNKNPNASYQENKISSEEHEHQLRLNRNPYNHNVQSTSTPPHLISEACSNGYKKVGVNTIEQRREELRRGSLERQKLLEQTLRNKTHQNFNNSHSDLSISQPPSPSYIQPKSLTKSASTSVLMRAEDMRNNNSPYGNNAYHHEQQQYYESSGAGNANRFTEIQQKIDRLRSNNFGSDQRSVSPSHSHTANDHYHNKSYLNESNAENRQRRPQSSQGQSRFHSYQYSSPTTSAELNINSILNKYSSPLNRNDELQNYQRLHPKQLAAESFENANYQGDRFGKNIFMNRNNLHSSTLTRDLCGHEADKGGFRRANVSKSVDKMSQQKENLMKKAEEEASRKILEIERRAKMKVLEKKSASGLRWGKLQ